MKKILIYLLIILLIGGIYFCYTHQDQVRNFLHGAKDTKDRVVAKTNTDIDGAIRSGVKSVTTVSQLYYFKNHNYGTSATQNICLDSTTGSIGSIIASIEKNTKKVSCVVDSDFPSRSFTLLAPSTSVKDIYYCTDQAGFFTLTSIDSTSTFKAGRRCK